MIALVRIAFVSLWSSLMITCSIVLMILTFNRRLPVAMARDQWAPGILWICGIKLKIAGAAKLDRGRPYIFVANHRSFLDIPILFRSIPVNLYFMAKKEVKKIPFVGWYMMATGMIFVDRGNAVKSMASLDKAARMVRGGKSVLMFPEGTRSRDGHLADFKKGPFKLAQKAKVDIAPVGIEQKGGAFQLNALRKTRFQVNIGPPSSIGGAKIQDWAKSVRGQVAALSGRAEKIGF